MYSHSLQLYQSMRKRMQMLWRGSLHRLRLLDELCRFYVFENSVVCIMSWRRWTRRDEL